MKTRKQLCADCTCKECTARREVAQALALGRPEGWVPDEGEWNLVAGVTRMGKSTWCKEEPAQKCVDEGVCIISWDPQRETSRHGIERERTPLGPLLTQVTVSELEEQAEQCSAESPCALLCIEDGAEAPAVAIVCDEEIPTREEVADGFVRAMKIVRRHAPKGRVVLWIEECGLLEGNSQAEAMLDELTTTTGKDGFGGFLSTQCTAMVPDRSRRNCRYVVSFRQLDDNDLVALTRLVGPRFRRVVERLKRHECVKADRMERHLWKDEAPEETGAESAA